MIIKFRRVSKLLCGKYLHSSSKKDQQKIIALNLKAYSDIPGPLDLPLIGSLFSFSKFSIITTQHLYVKIN